MNQEAAGLVPDGSSPEHQSAALSFDEVQAHAQRFLFGRYLKKARKPRQHRRAQQPVHLQCRKGDVVRAYCCLWQMSQSLTQGSYQLRDVREYARQRQQFYAVPAFTGTDYLEEADLAEETEQMWDALARPDRGHAMRFWAVQLCNRFRRDTFLIDAITLRVVQCGFQQLAVFLNSDMNHQDAIKDLSRLLSAGSSCLRASIGERYLGKAWAIESFHPPFPWRQRYTFEEILADL